MIDIDRYMDRYLSASATLVTLITSIVANHCSYDITCSFGCFLLRWSSYI